MGHASWPSISAPHGPSLFQNCSHPYWRRLSTRCDGGVGVGGGYRPRKCCFRRQLGASFIKLACVHKFYAQNAQSIILLEKLRNSTLWPKLKHLLLPQRGSEPLSERRGMAPRNLPRSLIEVPGDFPCIDPVLISRGIIVGGVILTGVDPLAFSRNVLPWT